VLGFAAVNGGINLLFLVFGMLLCLLIANGVHGGSLHAPVAGEPTRLPHAIYAGSPFLMGIAVRNHKDRIATFSLEVEDLASDGKPRGPALLLPQDPGPSPAGNFLPADVAPSRNPSPLRHSPLHALSLRALAPVHRRGSAVDLLVYPALVPVSDIALRTELSQLGERQSRDPRAQRGVSRPARAAPR
jgi:hypothetical protein